MILAKEALGGCNTESTRAVRLISARSRAVGGCSRGGDVAIIFARCSALLLRYSAAEIGAAKSARQLTLQSTRSTFF
jgi:hypothetical protein